MLIGTLCLCLNTAFAQKRKHIRTLEKQLESSELFSQIFTGFALYDMEQDTFLVQHEADKYYTPASNTKLFTLYASLLFLGDSIPTLHYQETDTSLIFWGAGDPSFLNADLPSDATVLDFFLETNKKLQFSNHNFKAKRFGEGWAWDDYNYYFQTERSPFPIYGNIVRFKHERDQVFVDVFPNYFENKIILDPKLPNRRPIFDRDWNSNIFRCNARALGHVRYERIIPFHYSDELFAQLLSDTLSKKVELFEDAFLVNNVKTLYSGVSADSIYQRLMQESDNFIAEQLLLLCSDYLFGVHDVERTIEYLKKNHLNDLVDEAIWVDGSGLSRYNLFSPRAIAKLLVKLYKILPQERLFNIFPAGGESGTIADWYANIDGASPYIFAKTGTLSNKHCLSGYIRCNSGKILVFSFMNNNYITGSKPVKREMQQVLEYIRNNF